jgi:rhodanese-related sulfurtransferase
MHEPEKDATPSCPQHDVHATRAKATAGEVTLIDVRDAAEYAEGHPAGASNLPLDQLFEALHELPAGPVTFTCRTGRRSQKAADAAVLAGRTDITNMTGGLEAWQAAGLPVDPDPASRRQEPT